MADNKIDCTKKPQENFTIEIVRYAEEVPSRISFALDALERLAGVTVHSSVFDTDASEIDAFIKQTVASPPQMLLIIATEAQFEHASKLAYRYNNTFHNSPNVLITALSDERFTHHYNTRQSFDLALNNPDENALSAFVLAIKSREYDGAPVDFSSFKGLAYRANGAVHFNA